MTLQEAIDNAPSWALWLLLAALVDICPLLCFASLSCNTKRNVSERYTTTETSNLPLQHARETTHATQPTDDLVKTIETEIKSGQYGDKPSVRSVMERHNIRYERVNNIFNQLQRAGIITRNGKRYHMTGVV